jgi:hypothetical protein
VRKLHAFVVSLVAALIVTGCGDLMFVEMELPEVCNQMGDAGFEGVDPALIAAAEAQGIPLDLGVQTVSQNFDFPLADNLPGANSAEFDGELSLIRVVFTAESGITDFSFVDSATIGVAPPAGSHLQSRTLLEYVKTPESAVLPTMTLDGARFDLIEYMRAGALQLSVSMTGRLPLQAWNVSVQGCGYLRGKYKYLE